MENERISIVDLLEPKKQKTEILPMIRPKKRHEIPVQTSIPPAIHDFSPEIQQVKYLQLPVINTSTFTRYAKLAFPFSYYKLEKQKKNFVVHTKGNSSRANPAFDNRNFPGSIEKELCENKLQRKTPIKANKLLGNLPKKRSRNDKGKVMLHCNSIDPSIVPLNPLDKLQTDIAAYLNKAQTGVTPKSIIRSFC